MYKIKKVIQKHKKKLLVAISFLFVITLGLTYAYLGPQIGLPSITGLVSQSDTTDRLIFVSGEELSINATTDNFGQGANNLVSESTTSAILIANNTTSTASDMYNVYFNVTKNDYEYTTAEKKPEIIMSITDPEGNEITGNTNLDYVTVIDAETNEEVSGYDITTFDGMINFASGYEISTNDDVNGTTQNWKVKVTYINLDTNQASNVDKVIEADVILTKENLINQSDLMLHMSNNYNPNSNGWTNRAVTYTVNITDPVGVGINSQKYCIDERICGPSIELAGNEIVVEKEGESLVCVEAVDNIEDNILECSSKVKIDTVDPLPGEMIVEGDLGDYGWYTSEVIISSTPGSDELSGHDVTVVDVPSITNSTESTIVTLTTVDKAGNSARIAEEVKVDLDDPVITGATNKTVGLGTKVDLLAGVSCTDLTSSQDYCRVNVSPTTIDTSVQGKQAITYTATDVAGNITTRITTVTVENDIPIVEYSVADGIINGNGWSDSDVEVSINIYDMLGLDIIAKKFCVGSNECTPEETLTTNIVTLSKNGENVICVLAVNENNKQAITCSDIIRIDKLAPVAGTIHFEGTMGLNDWYRGNVVVSSTGSSDSISSISTHLSETLIDYDTTGKTITLTVTDQAGNKATSTKSLKRDATVPTVPTYTITRDSLDGTVVSNSTAWRNYSIFLKNITGSDVTSNVLNYQYSTGCTGTVSSTSTSDSTYSYVTDTYNNYFCWRTVDNAGNVSDWSNPFYAKIDKVAPVAGTILANGTLGNNDWYISNVTVSSTGSSDALSGVASTQLNYTYLRDDTPGFTYILTTTDNARNTSTSTRVLKKDSTAPTLPTVTARYNSASGAAYTSGTWTNNNVYIGLTATDNLSGVVNYSTFEAYVSNSPVLTNTSSLVYTNEMNKSYHYAAVDAAGNIGPYTWPDDGNNPTGDWYVIKIDKTAPSIPNVIARYGHANGAIYTSGTITGDDVFVGMTATDSASGVSYFEESMAYGETAGLPNNRTSTTGFLYNQTMNKSYHYRTVDNAGNVSAYTWPSPPVGNWVWVNIYKGAFSNYIVQTQGNDQGLHYHSGQGAHDNNYRYSGEQPSNYVCFGSDVVPCPANNLYRIIGVFSNRVKLIKVVGYGQMFYGNSNNSWASSTVKSTLNNNFFYSLPVSYRNLIDNNTWTISGNNTYLDTPKLFYDSESSSISTDVSKIGLPYVYDIGFASNPSDWADTMNTFANNASSNWMISNTSGDSMWTMSKVSGETGRMFILHYSGKLDVDGITDYNYNTFPTFYMYSSVQFSSGTGTYSNPFRIKH